MTMVDEQILVGMLVGHCCAGQVWERMSVGEERESEREWESLHRSSGIVLSLIYLVGAVHWQHTFSQVDSQVFTVYFLLTNHNAVDNWSVVL